MRSVLLSTTQPRRSPALVTLFAGAFVTSITGKVVDELWKAAEERIRERITRGSVIGEDLVRLFDPSEDSQFILGERLGQVQGGDRETGLRLLESLPVSGHVKRSPAPDPPVELNSNIYSIGSIANAVTCLFTRNITVTEAATLGVNTTGFDERRLVELPFTFAFDADPRSGKSSTVEISAMEQLDPPLNFAIVEQATGRIYTPRYNSERKYYDRDYLMLAKIPNAHVSGRIRGTKCIIVAGTHGLGTRAAQRLLARTMKSRELLDELRKKVGPSDFQVIYRVLWDVEHEHPELDLFKLELI